MGGAAYGGWHLVSGNWILIRLLYFVGVDFIISGGCYRWYRNEAYSV